MVSEVYSGRTERAQLIRLYLMKAVKAGDANFIQKTADMFNVSRQAIFAHLKVLVSERWLDAEGKTRARTYRLGPRRVHWVKLPLRGLDESAVFYREFGWIFNDLEAELQKICDFGFTEMLNNAIDHSGGTEAEILVSRHEDSLTISIKDNGEGIFNHIARILGLNDPRQSILELSKGKLTTDPDHHSGQGIFFTSRVFDYFFIISCDLTFTHRDGQKNDFILPNEELETGTSVLMKIALTSTKNLKAVFDSFTGGEEESFAFSKTIVPVQLAVSEGERLVSRSQAKRILNRFEKFSTVVLDFEGVDTIGQAFADEVFRVFARKHPEIELHPIHITEDVRKAIQAAQSGND